VISERCQSIRLGADNKVSIDVILCSGFGLLPEAREHPIQLPCYQTFRHFVGVETKINNKKPALRSCQFKGRPFVYLIAVL
jgi:hypothetical protein